MMIRQTLQLLTSLLRKRKILLCIVVVSYIIFCKYYLLVKPEKPYYFDFKVEKRSVEDNLTRLIKSQEGKECTMPYTDPFSKEAMRFYKYVPKLECPGNDWVECQFSECYVRKQHLDIGINVKCSYRDILYVNDNQYVLGPTTTVLGANRYSLVKSDHVQVRCSSKMKNGTIVSARSWKGKKAGFRKLQPPKTPAGRTNKYNIMILIFDSTSSNSFIRQMPLTYDYLKNTVGAFILNRYNIVGIGTPGALFPILTGKNELEHPDARWSYATRVVSPVTQSGISNTSTVEPKNITEDVYIDEKTFIFHEATKLGYRTSYLEDRADVGTFQYRYNGLQCRPTDHYLRHFYLDISKKLWVKDPTFLCAGDQPNYRMLLNLTKQFLQLDGYRFGLTFISDLSHDDFNMIQICDEDVKDLVSFVHKSKLREDTVLIVMGDHGYRFSDFRLTYQGVIEERLPFVSITLPVKMANERPDAVEALKENQERLSTPYDLHTTLLDILDLLHLKNEYRIPGADIPRGMSLLRSIPKFRTCAAAGVLPHWCACMHWNDLVPTDGMYHLVPNKLTEFINNYTSVSDLCAMRSLFKIEWVKKKAPEEIDLLQTDKTDETYYKTKIIIDPGASSFEATIKHVISADKLEILLSDISRVDRYGNQSSCIADNYRHLARFCYCKTQ